MIRSRIATRPGSTTNLDNVSGSPQLPACYAFRLIPLAADPANGVLAGTFPVTLVKPNGGEPLVILDSGVHYFENRLIDEDGRGAFVLMGNAQGAPDRFLVVWSDSPRDRIIPPQDPAAPGFVWDSKSVAAGAQIQSPVLDLSRLTSLEIIVDNTLGTTLRDLTLASFLPDGVTQLDSFLVRRVAFGLAGNGVQFDPGRARGLISPNPPGFVTEARVLFDFTTAANAALDTGALLTEEADQLVADMVTSAGTSQLVPFRVWDDGTSHQAAVAPAASASQSAHWGPGDALPTGDVGVALPSPPTRRSRFTCPAAGVANTVRLIVTSRGRPPGTFSHAMKLPPRGQVTLAAGGATAARLTLIGA